MAYWMDLENSTFSAHIMSELHEVWGPYGITSYCVNNEPGPSQSYMMVL
jgi:hypothetical protein